MELKKETVNFGQMKKENVSIDNQEQRKKVAFYTLRL